MSVYYCPVCSLIFPARTEVEWHLRNEHRTADEEAQRLEHEITAGTRGLDWPGLRTLQSAVSDPSVTMLLGTSVAEEMTSLDRARLERLATQAQQRLRGQIRANALTAMETRLSRTVSAAQDAPTEAGLAVLVSRHHLAILRLPFEPVERVVVEPTFATRDLLAALQHFPPYRIIVAGAATPRILEGHGRQLTEVAASHDRPKTLGRPLSGADRVEEIDGSGPRQGLRPAWMRSRRAAIRAANQALDDRAAVAGDLPLVVVGSSRLVAAFCQEAGHARVVIGTVRGAHTRASRQELADLAQPALATWRAERTAGQLRELETATQAEPFAWGFDEAWRAASRGDVERLWVEGNYGIPTRLLATEGIPGETTQPASPGLVVDRVDELIELVAGAGKPVEIVDRLPPERPEPIAVQLRTPTLVPARQ